MVGGFWLRPWRAASARELSSQSPPPRHPAPLTPSRPLPSPHAQPPSPLPAPQKTPACATPGPARRALRARLPLSRHPAPAFRAYTSPRSCPPLRPPAGGRSEQPHRHREGRSSPQPGELHRRGVLPRRRASRSAPRRSAPRSQSRAHASFRLSAEGFLISTGHVAAFRLLGLFAPRAAVVPQRRLCWRRRSGSRRCSGKRTARRRRSQRRGSSSAVRCRTSS